MEELAQKLEELLAQAPSKILLSAPRVQGLPRAELTRLENGWLLSRQKGTQAFHSPYTAAQLPALLAGLLREEYTQLTAFTKEAECRLRLSKKGKVLTSKTALQSNSSSEQNFDSPAPQHNRPKEYLLPQGLPIAPLVDMGIFTPDGRVVKRMYDKYRQVNRFVEIIDDALQGEEKKNLRIIDFGCGKSYLTFVLYHYLTEVRGFTLQMTGLDLKKEVVAHCAEAAARYGYTGLHFACGDIAQFETSGPVDMVLCLHACDTATDLALAQALRWGAKRIFAVPCCQHELNAQMQSEAFSLLTRYGIIQERVAAAFTDAIRANLLCAQGYKSQLLEFVGPENTPKNLLMRAVKTGQPTAVRSRAMQEVQQLCAAFALRPSLLRLLEEEEGPTPLSASGEGTPG